MKHKVLKSLALLGVFGLGGGALVLVGGRTRANEKAAAEAGKQDLASKRKTLVKVEIVRPRPMKEYLILPGTVEAWQDIDLSAKIGGTVDWVGPEEGDPVSSGEAIVRLDTAALVAHLNQAKAQLYEAEKDYGRTAKLVRDHVMMPAQLDAALAKRDIARANLEAARVALDNATVRSPIAGIADRIPVDRGEHVNAGQTVAKIVQIDKVKIVVHVPEKDVRYFRVGQQAGVFLDDIRLKQMVPGKIYYLAVTADPFSRTFPMKIVVDNSDGRFRPGMIVRVGLVRRKADRALTAPLFAVVDRGDHKAIFVEKQGRAVERRVVPGIVEGGRVQIVEGLSEGERLIVVGQRDLTDGEEIEVEGVVNP